MPISPSLKEHAKRNKVRITFDNAFGQRKQRKPNAIKKEIIKKQKKKNIKNGRITKKVSSGRNNKILKHNKSSMAKLIVGGTGIASLAALAYAANSRIQQGKLPIVDLEAKLIQQLQEEANESERIIQEQHFRASEKKRARKMKRILEAQQIREREEKANEV